MKERAPNEIGSDDGNARPHGVTPILSRDYARRSAGQQARFVEPYLSRGLDLVDVGCGPGSITLGMGTIVAPGRVVGIDHDPQHVSAARALATARGLHNVTFETGDALALPLEADRFDVAFENDLFVHLAARAVDAADEIRRVLKPGGILAARDSVADAAVWGNHTATLREFDAYFFRWQAGRGSDLNLGRRLPAILREAGYETVHVGISADTKWTASEVRDQADMMLSLLEGPVGRGALSRREVDRHGIDDMASAIRTWGSQPGSYFANIHLEVIGRKIA